MWWFFTQSQNTFDSSTWEIFFINDVFCYHIITHKIIAWNDRVGVKRWGNWSLYFLQCLIVLGEIYFIYQRIGKLIRKKCLWLCFPCCALPSFRFHFLHLFLNWNDVESAITLFYICKFSVEKVWNGGNWILYSGSWANFVNFSFFKFKSHWNTVISPLGAQGDFNLKISIKHISSP